MSRYVVALAALLSLTTPRFAFATGSSDSAPTVSAGSGADELDEAVPEIKHKKKKKAHRTVEEEQPAPADTPATTDTPPPSDDQPKTEQTPTEDQGGLNFDLNVTPKSDQSVTLTAPVNTEMIRVRRTMLILHQTIGIVLTATMLGSVITGQLNYSDKFTGPNSGRYELAHQIFVWPTEGLAAVTAGLAIFAPVPIDKESEGFDRMTVHKIGQFTAFAGWATELVLGVLTASREGYANQQTFAAAHLAVGYLTLAGMLLGVGAIVF